MGVEAPTGLCESGLAGVLERARICVVRVTGYEVFQGGKIVDSQR